MKKHDTIHKTVYIAGPMRGIPDLNFPAFDEAKRLAIALGWNVISPADMDRRKGIDPQAPQDSYSIPEVARKFAAEDLEVLTCDLRAEDGDAVAVLPGWERSTGTIAEVATALWCGLSILDARTMKPLEEKNIIRGAIGMKFVDGIWKANAHRGI